MKEIAQKIHIITCSRELNKFRFRLLVTTEVLKRWLAVLVLMGRQFFIGNIYKAYHNFSIQIFLSWNLSKLLFFNFQEDNTNKSCPFISRLRIKKIKSMTHIPLSIQVSIIKIATSVILRALVQQTKQILRHPTIIIIRGSSKPIQWNTPSIK